MHAGLHNDYDLNDYDLNTIKIRICHCHFGHHALNMDFLPRSPFVANALEMEPS